MQAPSPIRPSSAAGASLPRQPAGRPSRSSPRRDSKTLTLHIDTPLGGMTLAATTSGLAGAWFDGQRHHPDLSACSVGEEYPVLRQAQAQLLTFLAGARRHFELPLDLRSGTLFQQSVWQALLCIAPGETCCYGDIARRIGRPAAVRAVGAAIGRNPLGIIVPCHRVLGADGALTGYAGGLERKRALLELESANAGMAPG